MHEEGSGGVKQKGKRIKENKGKSERWKPEKGCERVRERKR